MRISMRKENQGFKGRSTGEYELQRELRMKISLGYEIEIQEAHN